MGLMAGNPARNIPDIKITGSNDLLLKKKINK